MTTTPTPRPVQSPEDRMRDATTPARPAMTFREARDAGLLPPAVALALPQDSDARTDTTDRSFAAYLTAQERDQLDARAATAEAARDDALNDRDAYREARDVLRTQLDRTLADLTDAGNTIDLAQAALRRDARTDPTAQIADLIELLTAERDQARASLTEALNQRQQLINMLVEVLAHFREPGHPGEPCLRTGWIKTSWVEQWHGVLASLKAIDVTPLLPQPALGSPADRAQDAEPCRGCFACSTAPACQTEREG